MQSPSVKVRASLGDGTYSLSGFQLTTNAHAIQLTLVDTTGINKCLWEIYSSPTQAEQFSGWTLDPVTRVQSYLGLVPPSLDFSGKAWGKYLIRATGNDGMRGGSVVVLPADGSSMCDESLAIESIDPSTGFRDVAEREIRSHFGGWIRALADNLRLTQRRARVGRLSLWSPGPIAAHSCVVSPGVTISNISITDSLLVTPIESNIESGLVAAAFCFGAGPYGSASVCLTNTTSSTITPTARTYRIAAFPTE